MIHSTPLREAFDPHCTRNALHRAKRRNQVRFAARPNERMQLCPDARLLILNVVVLSNTRFHCAIPISAWSTATQPLPQSAPKTLCIPG